MFLVWVFAFGRVIHILKGFANSHLCKNIDLSKGKNLLWMKDSSINIDLNMISFRIRADIQISNSDNRWPCTTSKTMGSGQNVIFLD